MIKTFTKFIYVSWGAFFLYWVIAACLDSGPRERRESILSRLQYLSLIGVAIGLIVFDPLIFGPLLWRFLPESLGAYTSGTVIVILGLGFAVWARLHLGQSWSSRVAIVEHQQLICTGPYQLVRHPIYAGGLLGLIGTAIILGEIRGLLAILLVLLAL